MQDGAVEDSSGDSGTFWTSMRCVTCGTPSEYQRGAQEARGELKYRRPSHTSSRREGMMFNIVPLIYWLSAVTTRKVNWDESPRGRER